MKRRLLSILSLFAMLCACTSVPVNQGTIPKMYENAQEAPAADAFQQYWKEPEQMNFVISEDASDILYAAAIYFCKELEEISLGSIKMNIIKSQIPQTQLTNGSAQAALLDKKEQMAFSLPLQATASSFLYTNYQNFTMRANAPEALSLLERFMRRENNLIPLAAFYQGSGCLLTDFPVTGYLHFEGSTIAVESDTEFQAALERLGVQTIAVSAAQERMELYSSDEVTGMEISLSELSKIQELPKPSYLLLSQHSTVPVWLVVNTGFFDSFTPAQQAGIKELCAYMTNLIDDCQIKQEQQLLDDINLSNLTIITELSNVRNKVFNTLEPLNENAAAPQVLARDIVDMMRRIS